MDRVKHACVTKCRRFGAIAFLSVLVHVTTTTPALAQQVSGADAVYLQDNNVLRGTLQEVVVGDHVTILLGNGQTARIVWSSVLRIDRQSGPTPAAPAAPPIQIILPPIQIILPPIRIIAPPGAEVPPSRGSVMVHIDGANVRLERLEGTHWVRVCESPCNESLPLDATYQVAGNGIRASRGFELKGNPGDRVVLSVAPRSKAGHALGTVLVSVGGAMIMASPYALFESENAALTLLAAGGAGTLVGLVLLLSGAHTRVAQKVAAGERGERAERRETGLASDAWKRVATWRDAEGARAPHPPQGAPLMFPLIQRSF